LRAPAFTHDVGGSNGSSFIRISPTPRPENEERRGEAMRGEERRGEERRGEARRGEERRGEARRGRK
jgi:hypothetical protein